MLSGVLAVVMLPEQGGDSVNQQPLAATCSLCLMKEGGMNSIYILILAI